MRGVYLFGGLLLLIILQACREDDSYKPYPPAKDSTGNIAVALAGRVGTVVGENLTTYVKSLNLFLFRENTTGDYVLYRNMLLDKSQLEALTENTMSTQPGFTVPREFVFDSVPLANYKIVGVGNVQDSLGNALPNVSLQGVTAGSTLNQVLVVVRSGEEASRLFWRSSDVVQVGATSETNLPVLSLYRKVAMFALTLEKIPSVVDRIDMDIEMVNSSFNMNGTFPGRTGSYVFVSNQYRQQVKDSITLTYVTLPTVAGDSSTFLTTFYLVNGPKQPITLPKYVLKPNTITKVTATIDPDQPGNIWKVNVNSLIDVDVEWNVDQEPPITI